MGIGLIVEVFDVDDVNNHTVHDSIDFYGRTLLDLKVYPSAEAAQPHRIYLRSLFGMYTNLTADFSVWTFFDANEVLPRTVVSTFSSTAHRIPSETIVKPSVHPTNNVTRVIRTLDRRSVNKATSDPIVSAVNRSCLVKNEICIRFFMTDVRACEDRPCLNNGTCLVYLHSYVCQCQKGFTGRSCEIGT